MKKPTDYNLDALNKEMMNEVRSIMGKRWPEMVEIYLDSAAVHIENIKNGFTEGDKKIVATSAHPLKSSSHTMGLMGLSEIAKTIEHETKDAIKNGGDISYLQILVPLLGESLKCAETKLRSTFE